MRPKSLLLNLSAILVALTVVFPNPAKAQSQPGRWVIGLRGGGNYWINDYNDRKVSMGGELQLAYGFKRVVSIGLVAGYNELKSNQSIPVSDIIYPYLKVEALPASLRLWFSFNQSGSFNPFLYVGGGVMLYKIKDHRGVIVSGKSYQATYEVPAGIGFEARTSRNLSIVLDLGYHLTNDKTDLRKYKFNDSYVSARFGWNFYLGTSDGDDDDNDGLTNGEEQKLGTNPEDPDTDHDGLKDGEEVKRYHTNPLASDSDGDGLRDADEVNTYHTLPNRADSDGDGLSDGDEILKYNTDPLKMDTDGDLLPDGDEVLKYKSDPWKKDTDGDGLSDWDEVNTYKTDPTKADTDGDGLSDSDEIRKYGTDPLKADTDGGGVNDGDEEKNGTNPMNPGDDTGLKLEKGKNVVLAGVYFATGSATITAESEPVLDKAFRALVNNPDLKVQIVGFTDNVGSTRVNQRLSLRRAQAVLAWLLKKGIAANRLSAVGRGGDQPIATNDTPEGRAMNRRIEFLVQK